MTWKTTEFATRGGRIDRNDALRRMPFSKLLVVGLDSAAPALVFERWRSALPTLSGLIARGLSTDADTNPPHHRPAWTAMLSSRDPASSVATASGPEGPFLRRLPVRDLGVGQGTAALGLARGGGPPLLHTRRAETYPPPKVNGELVSCFLTPSTQSCTRGP